MENNKNMSKFKKVIFVLLYLCFTILSACIFYLYSLRSDVVSWGNSNNDGLYFLILFYYYLPLLLMLSILKIALWKKNGYVRYGFLFYTFLVVLPAIVSIGEQRWLSIGMLTCIVVLILIILEYITFVHKRIFFG